MILTRKLQRWPQFAHRCRDHVVAIYLGMHELQLVGIACSLVLTLEEIEKRARTTSQYESSREGPRGGLRGGLRNVGRGGMQPRCEAWGLDGP